LEKGGISFLDAQDQLGVCGPSKSNAGVSPGAPLLEAN
jgi:hypothetical protein